MELYVAVGVYLFFLIYRISSGCLWHLAGSHRPDLPSLHLFMNPAYMGARCFLVYLYEIFIAWYSDSSGLHPFHRFSGNEDQSCFQNFMWLFPSSYLWSPPVWIRSALPLEKLFCAVTVHGQHRLSYPRTPSIAADLFAAGWKLSKHPGDLLSLIWSKSTNQCFDYSLCALFSSFMLATV